MVKDFICSGGHSCCWTLEYASDRIAHCLDSLYRPLIKLTRKHAMHACLEGSTMFITMFWLTCLVFLVQCSAEHECQSPKALVELSRKFGYPLDEGNPQDVACDEGWLAMRHLDGKGAHRTLVVQIEGSKGLNVEAYQTVEVMQLLPAELFADPYELERLSSRLVDSPKYKVRCIRNEQGVLPLC